MYTENGSIVLERVVSFSCYHKYTATTDITGSRVEYPNAEIIRLYEALKMTVERRGGDWIEYCNRLFEEKK